MAIFERLKSWRCSKTWKDEMEDELGFHLETRRLEGECGFVKKMPISI